MLYVGGAAGMRNRGGFAAAETYLQNDLVTYQGSTYMAVTTSTGNAPTDTSSWQLLAGGYVTGVDSSVIAATRSQSGAYPVAGKTTTTAATQLTMDGLAPVATGSNPNVLLVPAYTNIIFELKLTARRVGGTTLSHGWSFQGIIARDNGACWLVGSVMQIASWTDGASLGTVTISANTTGNYLQIQTTATAATTTSWNGRLTTIELSTAS